MRISILLVVLCLPCQAFGAELDAGQLRGELVGQLIQWWESDGWHSGNLRLLPDGRAEIIVERPDAANDDGQWSIRGNEICTAWSSMRNRETKCYSVEQLAPGRFITSGGNVFEIMTAGV